MERKQRLLQGLAVLGVGGALAVLIGLVAAGEERVSGPRVYALQEPAAYEEPSEPELVPAYAPVQEEPGTLEAVKQTSTPPPGPSKNRKEFARLRGIVLEPEGGPASNAHIVLGKQHARCDHEGHFELVLAAAPSGADLVAFESGFEPVVRASYGSGLAEGVEDSVRLVLGAPTLTIAGTLVDPAGSPVKGWTVELDERDPLLDLGLRERVKSDEEGRFTLTDVCRGVHVVRAWKEMPALAVRSDAVDAGATGVKITVDE